MPCRIEGFQTSGQGSARCSGLSGHRQRVDYIPIADSGGRGKAADRSGCRGGRRAAARQGRMGFRRLACGWLLHGPAGRRAPREGSDRRRCCLPAARWLAAPEAPRRLGRVAAPATPATAQGGIVRGWNQPKARTAERGRFSLRRTCASSLSELSCQAVVWQCCHAERELTSDGGYRALIGSARPITPRWPGSCCHSPISAVTAPFGPQAAPAWANSRFML